jgi:hypothetical protein
VAENATQRNRVSGILCRRTDLAALVKSATMSEPTKIHSGKEPVRRHFIKEWMEHLDVSVTDLLTALNDDERAMDLPRVDKSQVYRWQKGQMPHPAMQKRIADALGREDPSELLRPPLDDWFVQFFMDRSAEERERMRKMLEVAFPKGRTGTEG